ncbi:MAG: hypothetical protein FJ271_23030 [Planctomycetes bacterium]|nr:hypothetical protein [Planctomycetota bacterium]
MNNPMRRAWHDLLRTWAVAESPAEQAFADVCRRYAEPGRYYHTLDHIQDMLMTVQSLAVHAQNLNAIKLAVWLHDVIYDSKASDNEERSAAYAERLCEQLGILDGPRVAALIQRTKAHDAGGYSDAKVLLDADLAVLGASAIVYQEYAANIRREYAWVPDATYRSGRRQVLERFLTRPAIYHFLSHLEKSARLNLATEIAGLEA